MFPVFVEPLGYRIFGGRRDDVGRVGIRLVMANKGYDFVHEIQVELTISLRGIESGVVVGNQEDLFRDNESVKYKRGKQELLDNFQEVWGEWAFSAMPRRNQNEERVWTRGLRGALKKASYKTIEKILEEIKENTDYTDITWVPGLTMMFFTDKQFHFLWPPPVNIVAFIARSPIDIVTRLTLPDTLFFEVVHDMFSKSIHPALLPNLVINSDTGMTGIQQSAVGFSILARRARSWVLVNNQQFLDEMLNSRNTENAWEMMAELISRERMFASMDSVYAIPMSFFPTIAENKMKATVKSVSHSFKPGSHRKRDIAAKILDAVDTYAMGV